MSSTMNEIFGGSTSSANTHNVNNNDITGALNPVMQNGAGASSQIANMLGLNGPAGQQQGFQNWQNSTGYQFGMQQGQDSITGNAATQGLLNSGSTLKALDTYGQNYANTQYQNYLNPLQNLMSTGVQAASPIASAGVVNNQNTSTSDGGPGKFIGALLGK